MTLQDKPASDLQALGTNVYIDNTAFIGYDPASANIASSPATSGITLTTTGTLTSTGTTWTTGTYKATIPTYTTTTSVFKDTQQEIDMLKAIVHQLIDMVSTIITDKQDELEKIRELIKE